MTSVPNEPPFGGGGMTEAESRATHNRWFNELNKFLTPYNAAKDGAVCKLYENGQQCGGCAFYIALTSDLGMDWGACANAASTFDRQVVFEHHTCVEWQSRPEVDDEETDS